MLYSISISFIALVYHVTGSYFLNSFFLMLCCSYNSSVSNVCQACSYGSVIPKLNWRPSSLLILSNPSKWDPSYAVLTVGRAQRYHSQETERETAERSGGASHQQCLGVLSVAGGKHCYQKKLEEGKRLFQLTTCSPSFRQIRQKPGGMRSATYWSVPHGFLSQLRAPGPSA